MSAWDYVSLEAPTRVARRALVTVLGAALCGGAALMASMRSHHNTFQNKASPAAPSAFGSFQAGPPGALQGLPFLAGPPSFCLASHGLNAPPALGRDKEHGSSTARGRRSLATRAGAKREEAFTSKEAYLAHLEQHAKPPKGFAVGNAELSFSPKELGDPSKQYKMRLTLLTVEGGTDAFAAVFTRNKFPGGPVIVGKKRLDKSRKLSALIINNKISNVCPGGVGDRGVSDSERVCKAVADALGLEGASEVLPSSTGVIGWQLPVEAMVAAVPNAVKDLQSNSLLPAAVGICTTDRYPKLRSYISQEGGWRIVGIAKGAGMIEPNMATMLAFILTDLDIDRTHLQNLLTEAVATSFNTISVDGDQSTSDTVVLLSSRQVFGREGAMAEFKSALASVTRMLADDIVRNGEGTQHVMQISVRNAPSDVYARDLARFVANSPLVKCAVSGCDPNVGRIVGAVGSFIGNNPDRVSPTLADCMVGSMKLSMGDTVIFESTEFKLDLHTEKKLSDYMLGAQLYSEDLTENERTYPANSRSVEVGITFGKECGSGKSDVIGSDLTKEYVAINADYRS